MTRQQAELLGTLARLSWLLAGPALVVLAIAAAALALPLAAVVLNSWLTKTAADAWNDMEWEEECARDPRMIEVRELRRKEYGGVLPPIRARKEVMRSESARL